KGYGASLKTGILNSKFEYIAISDADGTYPVAKYHDLIKELGDYDMVVGARSWSSISKLRLVPKYILTILSSFLAGKKIEDLNSGMRIFKKEMSKQFWNLYPNGFSFTSTITMGAFTSGYEVKYVPIDYYKRDGKSHIHPIKDTIGFFTLVSRLTLYFNPIRFFMPLSFILLILAIARGIRDYLVTESLGGLTLVLFFMSFQVFFFGLLAEIIRRK
nr:glycosyltransferase family 2 protein [Candidatus Woesearchaeota archaeon]